ncbi:squalene synthase HpnC [Phenylobacterium sp.]|uniref:squalene synthase HpnC n=1 Tax=Phenylobacterium sp. TaxID=1871053 RepID=UPI0011FD1C01|nr:squalene synthase HpnC [Phenylobacterium sp.]THD61318.1 MAG: squalene synthase HpnC [Phenylobacterium sp.]
MSAAQDLVSGKGHKDENFPVASVLIEPRYRAPVMAFYRFARTADDVADHATASDRERLRLLEEMRATLTGKHDRDAPALGLRQALAERKLPVTHALDLLEAFRRDVVKSRYANWDELMDYCRYSAAPVGRMVLDIHGEAQATWAASDALCAALQVINHLQDCAKDYRELDRVYLPEEDLAAAGLDVTALAQPAASPGLRLVISSLARQTRELLARGRPLAGQIRNGRLRLEVAFIQRVAEDLTQRLMDRDPLSERVHHRKLELIPLAGSALARALTDPRDIAVRGG